MPGREGQVLQAYSALERFGRSSGLWRAAAAQADLQALSAASAAASTSAAAASAAAAATSEANASASATAAATSATSAAASATAAATSATSAANSATSSANSASAAATSAASAATSASSAAASYELFDDRYLGAKATPPTTDNDGNPLTCMFGTVEHHLGKYLHHQVILQQ